MKLSQTSLAVMATVGLLSLAPSVRAEDPKTPTPPPAHRNAMQKQVDDQVKNLTDKLKLTAEQQPKVKAVFEARDKAMQGVMELSHEVRQVKMTLIHEEDVKKLKQILTADQFKQYEELGKKKGSGTLHKTEVKAPAETKAPAPVEEGAKKK